jgi:hypothetical protein
MKKDAHNLTRAEKILMFLYDFGKGHIIKVRYEDIVVGIFKKYPHEFCLKGYEEYPDSGDMIHKPLYDFKKKGYVIAMNKVFSLTERGVEYAKQLKTGNSDDQLIGRLSRSSSTEVSRIKGLEGFGLFIEGNGNNLSENDFYNYLGVTVRTPKNAFIGRLETMNVIVAELEKQDNKSLYENICKYHEFLLKKYNNVIGFFTNN